MTKCEYCKKYIKKAKTSWYDTMPFHRKCLDNYKAELRQEELESNGRGRWYQWLDQLQTSKVN